MKRVTSLFILLFFWLSSATYAQRGTVVLGTGTSSNSEYLYPTPYGTLYKNLRQQYLVKASELSSLGMMPGNISAIGFKVANVNTCSPMPNYTMQIKATTASVLTSTFDNEGYTEVWSMPSFLPVAGWNTHTFDTPFYWDGSSNLIVDVCFDIIPGFYTANASVYYTPTTTNLSAYYAADGVVACGTAQAAILSPNRANMQITGLVASCLPPILITANNITSNSALISWTPVGSTSQWDLLYGVSGFNPLTQGTLVEGIVNPAYSLTGIAHSTGYDVYVRSDCGATVSPWGGPATFLTSCGVFSLPFDEDFDGTNFPAICWSKFTGLLADSTILSTTTSGWEKDEWLNDAGNTDMAAKLRIWSFNTKHWLVTPEFDLGDGSTPYQIQFDLALMSYNTSNPPSTSGVDDKFAVVISLDGGVSWSSANTVRLWDNAGSAYVYNEISNLGQRVVIPLTNYSGLVKIGFYGESTVNNANNDLMINNLFIQPPPTCPSPLTLIAQNPKNNRVDLSWTPAGDESIWDVAYGDVGFDPQTEGTTVTGITTNPYTLTGLVGSTTYHVYVRADCGTDEVSTWTGPITFITLCEQIALPYLENFDGATGSLPLCWNKAGLEVNNWSISYTTNAQGSAPELRFRATPSFTGEALAVSPLINTTGEVSLVIEFKHFFEYSTVPFTFGMKTTSDGITWNTVWQVVDPTGDIGPETVSTIVDNNDVGSPYFQFAFFIDGNTFNMRNWYMDDINVFVPAYGILQGTVTEATRGPIEGAMVTAGEFQTYTDATGHYSIETLLTGTYEVTYEAQGYFPVTVDGVEVVVGQTTIQDAALGFATISVAPASLTQTLLPNTTATKTLIISNTGGTEPLSWSGIVEILEKNRQIISHPASEQSTVDLANKEVALGVGIKSLTDDWLTIDPSAGVINPGESQTVIATFDATDLADNTYLADILISHNGQQRTDDTLIVPATLIVASTVAPLPPTDPMPISGATLVPLQPLFSWTNGDGTATTKFMLTKGMGPFAQNVYISNWFIGDTLDLAEVGITLLPKTSYSWQVTCKNAAGSTEGPKWTLQTIGIGSINGMVTDAYSTLPIEGATISVEPGGYTATTSSTGAYSITDVLEGSYTVSAEKSAYISDSLDITVVNNQAAMAGFALNLFLNPPSGLQAAVEDFINVNLTWNTPGGGTLTGFNVYRNGDLLVTTDASTTQIDDLDLDAGTYVYTVKAIYLQGESEPVGPITVAILPPPVLLSADPDFFGVDLLWEAGTNYPLNLTDNLFVSYFKVYRDGVNIADVYGNTYYDDVEITNGEEYCYTISEVKAEGLETTMSNQLCATIPVMPVIAVYPASLIETHFTPPAQITSQSVTLTNDGQSPLDWMLNINGSAPTDDDYCIAAASNQYEFISNVLCGSINNASGWQSGVADYTALSTNIGFGASEPIIVTNGFADASDLVTCWVDWNLDYTFGIGTNEEFILTSVNGGASFTGNITVPAGTFAGDYRMRIRMDYADTPVPCGTTAYGEIEDYTISVGGPWLSVDLTEGTLAPGASIDINVTFNSEGLMVGNYNKTLVFMSNDPISPELIVPVEFNVAPPATSQDIGLTEGWSAWSSYLTPAAANVADVMATVVPNMVVTQHFGEVFYPAYSINNMGMFSNNHGYLTKMAAEATLTTTGAMADPTITLHAGWNLISVLQECFIPAEDVFSIIDGFVIAYEPTGNGIYYPAYNINTLINLMPGKAYYVKVSQDGEYTYPGCTKSSGNVLSTPLRAANTTFWNDVSYTGVNHVVAFDAKATNNLRIGDMIGAFAMQSVCAGLVEYTGDNLGFTLFGDDITTPAADGLTDGNVISYKVFRPETGEEFTMDVVYSLNAPNSSTFAANGLSVITDLKLAPLSIGENTLKDLSIYPNPSSGIFNITVSGSDAEINYLVMNARGQEVCKGNLTESQQLDLSSEAKGVYFIKFIGQSVLRIKKLVVR